MPPNFAEMRHVLNIAQARPPTLCSPLPAISVCNSCDAQLQEPSFAQTLVCAWSCKGMQK